MTPLYWTLKKALSLPLVNFSIANCLAMELEVNNEMDICFPALQATESCCKWS